MCGLYIILFTFAIGLEPNITERTCVYCHFLPWLSEQNYKLYFLISQCKYNWYHSNSVICFYLIYIVELFLCSHSTYINGTCRIIKKKDRIKKSFAKNTSYEIIWKNTKCEKTNRFLKHVLKFDIIFDFKRFYAIETHLFLFFYKIVLHFFFSKRLYFFLTIKVGL